MARFTVQARDIEVIDDRTAAILRGMGGLERLRRGLAMHRYARDLLAASLREQHPEWSQEMLSAEMRRRWMCGAE